MTPGLPFWLDQTQAPEFSSLASDMEVDVAIVGGGIVGLHCAYRLLESGLQVVLLEGRRVGRQATGRSTAKITSQHGQKYSSLIKKFGEAGAGIYAEANEAAVAEIAALAKALPDGAGLEPRAAYVYATDEKEAKELEREADAARRLGLPAEIVRDAGLPFATASLLKYDGQYQFDPYRYLVGLAARVGETFPIFEDSRVTSVGSGRPSWVSVNGHTVTAKQVVVATQMPIINHGLFYTKAYPFAHPVAAARLPAEKSIDGMFISAGAPSHSLRTAHKNGETYLVAAGGEYRSGETKQQKAMVADLRRFLEETFGIRELTHLWTNEDFRAMDGAAFVGPANAKNEHIMVATGFDAWGITQGVVAADILSERILGRTHRAAKLFDSTRVKPIAGGAEFALENVKAAAHLFGDRVLKRSAVSADSIAPGEAGVVARGRERVAVAKGADGSTTELSAVCTHMGCIVGWNEVDRTWDCPCHGSRFDESGKVLSGPAVSPLAPTKKGG